ncbi:hypothetical protein G0Q06_02110 [Puniceicoccales bacterium CK1056]|uniref:PEP-CTERM sorting domain-containing protein n=1 Tax=Oceanipulchritudo coccoides TaxID=2706888 RepID=A0A6B2M0G5_9BACT|nr:hypothetical protein [Oceanipulchritudo coccoides]NDV61240.1 hypothetical protein [Oceanipulchritudo coccoides]
MKKLLFIVPLLGLVATATAQTTHWAANWATVQGVADFNTDYYFEATANTPADVAGGTDAWYNSNGAVNPNIASSGKGGIFQEQTNGASRGTSYVLDSSFFSGAGTYTFNYEIWAIYTPTDLSVSIWEATGGAEVENSYNINNAGPAYTDLSVTSNGTSTIALKGRKIHKRDLEGGDVVNKQWDAFSFTFEYSGSGDVVIHIWGRKRDSAGEFAQVGFTIGGDMSITSEGGSSPTWAGYDIAEGGLVDTGDFLGWLNVGEGTFGDWVFSYDLDSFLFLPEEIVDPQVGSWAYVPR